MLKPAKAIAAPGSPDGGAGGSERDHRRHHRGSALDAVLDVELLQPSRRELDLPTLPVPGVVDGRAQRERAALETVEPVGGRAVVVLDLFDPSADAADAPAVGEPLDQLRVE